MALPKHVLEGMKDRNTDNFVSAVEMFMQLTGYSKTRTYEYIQEIKDDELWSKIIEERKLPGDRNIKMVVNWEKGCEYFDAH